MNKANNYIISNLKSSRLSFRKLTIGDIDAWMQFINSEEALKFLPYKLGSRKACQEWIERQIWRYKETKSGLCALIHKETKEIIGQCGLLVQDVDDREEIEIGYHILPKFWKQGYALEAAKAAKDYAFKNDLTESLISIIDVNNIGSQKVAEKNGMTREKQTKWRGFSIFVYRITKEEWSDLNSNK